MKPEKIQKWDKYHYMVCYNFREVTREGEVPITDWEYDFALVEEVTYSKIVEAIIRTKYSMSDEIALIRQRETKEDEFNEYYSFAEQAKEWAKEVLQ